MLGVSTYRFAPSVYNDVSRLKLRARENFALPSTGLTCRRFGATKSRARGENLSAALVPSIGYDATQGEEEEDCPFLGR